VDERGRNDDGGEPSVARFLGDPTRDLKDWRWLWDGDHRFPVRSHRGVLGRLLVAFKRLLRPFVATPTADLWERQRIWNLIILEYLLRGEDTRTLSTDAHLRVDGHDQRLEHLEGAWRQGMAEVMEHNDALFARADQKLDRLRRETREIWSRLSSSLAVAETAGAEALSEVRKESAYLQFENRYRGTEEEITGRVSIYLPRVRDKGPLLDLGCGRGEALAYFQENGIPCRGVDGSEAMVEECRRKGLEVERADLFDALARTEPGSLGAVVSFHVVEHLPIESLDRLVRLARRALAPGGVLILETPNPLSLTVAARNFWIDPTHRRPVHPETLAAIQREAGFDPVERLDLHPFASGERLPEISLEGLGEEERRLAHRLNELRDRLDEHLFGFQDYALIGTRPAD